MILNVNMSKWGIRPRPAIVVVSLIILGWALLCLSVFDMLLRGVAVNAGPGMGVFSNISPIRLSDILGQAYKFSICTQVSGQWGMVDFFKSYLMWGTMILAMMVPTLLSGNRHPPKSLHFISGYILVWSIGSVFAVILHWLFHINAALDTHMVSQSSMLNALILFGVGIFQLSPLKQKQLTACRHTTPDGSGWQAGLNCLACCGPLMMVMFVFGLMNVVMMAALTVFMLMERATKPGYTLVKLSGLAFIAMGFLSLS